MFNPLFNWMEYLKLWRNKNFWSLYNFITPTPRLIIVTVNYHLNTFFSYAKWNGFSFMNIRWKLIIISRMSPSTTRKKNPTEHFYSWIDTRLCACERVINGSYVTTLEFQIAILLEKFLFFFLFFWSRWTFKK